MAVATTKAGPYYTSGQIKFSDLRRDFRAQQRKTTSGGSETFNTDNGSISASEFLRDTDTTEQNPIVPDCTENETSGPSNSGIAATQSNWKVSQFRNSIKYYYITQSGTNENFDIDAQDWNTNLDKNINKIMFIDGTCGSDLPSSPAATFNATAHNLTLDVYGYIYGGAGRGGGTTGAPAISGEDGGNALTMSSSGGNNIRVLVRSGSRIYGGGGGGEKGLKGSNGSRGTCYNWSYYSVGSGCEWCGSCGDGERIGGCNGVAGCACFIWCRRTLLASAQCRRQNRSDRDGGTGGEGGNGGLGQGYSNQSGGSAGAGGAAGAGGNCNGFDGTISKPGDGQTGETGGAGGSWASSGGNTTNSGSGGSGGAAVTGSNYGISGVLNASTIKGSYLP